MRIVERLLAQTVARQKQFLPARIPDCKRKHAAQMLHAVRAILLIQMHNDLGVALRREHMPARQQRRAQLTVVIDLAIKRNPDRAILIRQRLMAAGRKIDD